MSLRAIRSEGALPVASDVLGDATESWSLARPRAATDSRSNIAESLSPVKGLRRVRTEGVLEANLSETLSPSRRRGGLTTAEKQCMRRKPLPFYLQSAASPQFSTKVADWCRSRASTETATLRSLPPEPASPSTSPAKRERSRTESTLKGQEPDSSPTVRGRTLSPRLGHGSQSPQKARVRATTLAPGALHVSPGAWDAQEECCARILRNIYPSTLTGLKFFQQGSKPGAAAGPELSFEAKPVIRKQQNALTMVRALVRKPSIGGRRKDSKNSTASIPAAPPSHQMPELQFIRREATWDVATDSAIGEHALRLVQGAASTRETYKSIRKKTIADTGAMSFKAPVFDFKASVASLHNLRKKILESYPCVHDAFLAIAAYDHADEGLDKREWCAALTSANFCALPEARAIYDVVDANKDGSVEPIEFQLAIEIIGQVTSMESLRKRLICLGFRSMTQAITMMNGGGQDMTMQPLTFTEFAAALERVCVLEPDEHKAIFNAVRDAGELGNSTVGRASLSDLACGLAVASPCLILEDLRMHMIDDHGSIEAAVQILCPDEDIRIDEFKRNACDNFGLTHMEAEALFTHIDLDFSHEVSQDEVTRALNLADASLDLEDCRRKLRQGYRSIKIAFAEAYAKPEDVDGVPNEFFFGVDEFIDVLRPLGLGKENVSRLVELTGVGAHGVSIPEFFSGAQLFAPSCILEELKMRLLQTHQSLEAAFRDVKDRRTPLTRRDFKSLLKKLGANCRHEDQIFNFFDMRCTGVTTASEVIVALQNLQCGNYKHSSPTELKALVDSNVNQVLNPFRRFASEVKARVKDDCKPLGGTLQASTTSPTSASHKTDLDCTTKSAAAKPAPLVINRLAQETVYTRDGPIPKNLQMRTTFLNIKSRLEVFPPDKEQKNMGEFTSYFGSNEDALSEQRRLISKNYSKTEERRIVERLKRGESRAIRVSGDPAGSAM